MCYDESADLCQSGELQPLKSVGAVHTPVGLDQFHGE